MGRTKKEEKSSTVEAKVDNKKIDKTKKKTSDDKEKKPVPALMMWYKEDSNKKLVFEKYRKNGLKPASGYFKRFLDEKVKEEYEKMAEDARAKWNELEQEED